MNINQLGRIIADNSNCYYSVESEINQYGFIELITDSVEPIQEIESYLSDLNIMYSKHYNFQNNITYTLIGDIATVLKKIGVNIDA